MLAAGDQAPNFRGTDQHGDTVRLSDFRGQKVVLYFYPKDDTPGCTTEARSFRDRYEDLQDAGIAVLGISADGVDSHKEFAERYELPFSLVADPEKEIIDKYGVRGAFGRADRVTFVIDEDGDIIRTYEDVDTETHATDILQDLQG